MTAARVVLSTCPEEHAERISETLLSQRLAACVNALHGIASRYVWEGKLESTRETLLVIKTDADRVPALIEALREAHPYDVPEILALPVEAGDAAYLRWVTESTRPSGGPPRTPAP